MVNPLIKPSLSNSSSRSHRSQVQSTDWKSLKSRERLLMRLGWSSSKDRRSGISEMLLRFEIGLECDGSYLWNFEFLRLKVCSGRSWNCWWSSCHICRTHHDPRAITYRFNPWNQQFYRNKNRIDHRCEPFESQFTWNQPEDWKGCKAQLNREASIYVRLRYSHLKRINLDNDDPSRSSCKQVAVTFLASARSSHIEDQIWIKFCLYSYAGFI